MRGGVLRLAKTNEPLRFYVTAPSFPIQREYYQQTFEAGVRARF